MWLGSYYLNSDNHFSLQRSQSKAGKVITLKLHHHDLCMDLSLVSVSQRGHWLCRRSTVSAPALGHPLQSYPTRGLQAGLQRATFWAGFVL